MMFAFALAQAGSEQAITAAQNLFGPVGVILSVIVITVIGGLCYAVKKLWDQNAELQDRNQKLQSDMTQTLRDVLQMMKRLDANMASFSSKYDRTEKRVESLLDNNRQEIIAAIRNQTNHIRAESEDA